jgi:hypothetical protein
MRSSRRCCGACKLASLQTYSECWLGTKQNFLTDFWKNNGGIVGWSRRCNCQLHQVALLGPEVQSRRLCVLEDGEHALGGSGELAFRCRPEVDMTRARRTQHRGRRVSSSGAQFEKSMRRHGGIPPSGGMRRFRRSAVRRSRRCWSRPDLCGYSLCIIQCGPTLFAW